MNPYKIFNTEELEKISDAIGTIADRDYSKDERNVMENNLCYDIMNKSSKNGDVEMARDELSSVLNKLEYDYS